MSAFKLHVIAVDWPHSCRNPMSKSKVLIAPTTEHSEFWLRRTVAVAFVRNVALAVVSLENLE